MRGERRKLVLALIKWILVADGRHENPSRWIAILVIVLVAATNARCQRNGFYDRFEWIDLDRIQATAAGSRPPDISVVLITDRDYDALFHSTSPLEVSVLASVVDAICALGPQALAVDILTDQPQHYDAFKKMPHAAGCRIVWAQDSLEMDGDAGDEPGAIRPHQLGKALGSLPPPADVCTALPLVGRDPDGVVRYYMEGFPIREPASPVSLHYEPTMPVVLHAFRSGSQRCFKLAAGAIKGARGEKIRFTRNRAIKRVPAGFILDVAEHPTEERRRLATDMIAGKLVVLGGGFRHARDVHATAVGQLSGAEVIANAVVSVDDPIKDFGVWPPFLVDLAVGLSLFAITARLRLRWPWAILVSATSSAAAAFLISWWLFKYVGFFLGVFGSLAGVVLGTVVDVSWEHLLDTFRAWLNELRPRIAQFRGSLAALKKAEAARENARRDAGV